MRMDLVRENEVYSIGAAYWAESLDLAEAFGWRPAGTLHPLVQWSAGREWDGNYWANDWQRVTDEDAHQLGVALYKAVAAIETAVEMTVTQKGALARLGLGLSTAESLKRIADFVSRGGFGIG